MIPNPDIPVNLPNMIPIPIPIDLHSIDNLNKRKGKEVVEDERRGKKVRDVVQENLNTLRTRYLQMAGSGSEIVPPSTSNSQSSMPLTLPFPWQHLSVEEMLRKNIQTISGSVCCMDCKNISTLSLDWREGFISVASHMLSSFCNMENIHECKPLLNTSFTFECPTCLIGNAMTYSAADVSSFNVLFTAFTHTPQLVPQHIMLEYLREEEHHHLLDLSRDDSRILLFHTFYLKVLRQLDPTSCLWSMMLDYIVKQTTQGSLKAKEENT